MIKKIASNIWSWVIAVFSILLFVFGIERLRRKNAENKAAQLEVDKTDAVLSTKIDNVNDDIKSEKNKESNLKDQLDQDKKNHQNLSDKEKESWWNK